MTEIRTDAPASPSHSAPDSARDRARTRQAVIVARLLEDMRALAALIRDHGELLLPHTVAADADAITHAERVIRGAMLHALPLPPVVAGRLDQVHA